MAHKRLFICIDIPHTLKQQLLQVQKKLNETGANVKWVDGNNLHLTLKFLGQCPASQCQHIVSSMKQTSIKFSTFNIQLVGLGTFPFSGRPKVVWVGVGGEREKLNGLQRSLEQNLAALGFPLENRKFSPHITMGRPREYGSMDDLQREVNKYKLEKLGEWQVSSIKLMQSTLTPAGPIYTSLEKVFLGT